MAKSERIGDSLQELSDVAGSGWAFDVATADLTVERLRIARHEAEVALRYLQELADKALEMVAARRSPAAPPVTGALSSVARGNAADERRRDG